MSDATSPSATADRATSAEIRTALALRQAALAVSGARGDDVFPALVRYLGASLGVDYALISVPLPGNPRRMRTLAFYARGEIVGPAEYDLHTSPCERVFGRDFHYIGSGLLRDYPAESGFFGGPVDSYAAVPLFDSTGAAIGLIAVLHGGTLADAALVESMLRIFAARAAAEVERAHTEERRRRSDESYRAIFEASEDAIFVHDWDTGAILDVNPKACETYRYTREEFRRIDVGQLSAGMPPYTLETAVQVIERAKRGERVCIEWHRRNKDGSLHWDEVYLRAANIAGERRVLAFTRDITERKRAEERLRASEEQYRTIFNASVDGVVLWTQDARVVDANPAFCRMVGCTREELLAAEPFQFVPPDGQAHCRRFFDDMRASVQHGTESVAMRKDGTTFHAEVHAVQVLHQGRPHLLAFIRDVTERKHAEEAHARLEAQLRQAQKMEAIGHLSGGIAHDFNNILTTILGYIAMAQERLGAKADEKLARYLERALRSGRQARDLIQQLLTFSRGQRGEARALHAAPVVKESIKLLRSTLPSSIEFETRFDDGLPAIVIDPVQLEQVLMNLCLNARDAMDRAGRLAVVLHASTWRDGVCTSCRKPVDGRYVELAVSDTGAGIAPEVMDRIFEPFFTTKEPGKGSGMGLSVVHGIVHEHGGHVVVESSPGAGATFRVLFPVREGEVQGETVSTEGTAAQAARRLKGRVLLVDDEPAVAEFMAELLSGWGLDVSVQPGGAEAKELFLRDPQRFDLVVTDLTMPRVNGLELARALLAARADIPIVLYTGYAERLTEQQTRECGIRALVTKPIDIDAFFVSVSTLLGANPA